MNEIKDDNKFFVGIPESSVDRGNKQAWLCSNTALWALFRVPFHTLSASHEVLYF